jgi:hypothetical protein
MLVLNLSLLSRECNLINALKLLVATVFMCSRHVVVVSWLVVSLVVSLLVGYLFN